MTFNLQAGVNLNIFGAVSGMFSGKAKKETAPDGSSTEQREEQAAVKGMHRTALQDRKRLLTDIDRRWSR